jgi:hypothetical protein
MRTPLRRRLAPAILALGIAGGCIGASASTALAVSLKNIHIGASCSKSQLNKTVKIGGTTVTCKEVTLYEWKK